MTDTTDLKARLRLIAAWKKPGGKTPAEKMPNVHAACTEAADALDAKDRAIERLETEVDRLEGLVHVPGVWRCAKCEFALIQSNLNAKDGSVTARDEPGDKCPNDGSPLWRVSYRDWALENEKGWTDLLDRKEAEIEGLRQVLGRVDALLTCRDGRDHYCPNCDNTTFEAQKAVRQVLKGQTP